MKKFKSINQKKLNKILLIALSVTTLTTIILGIDRRRYEEALTENYHLKSLFEDLSESNNVAVFNYYIEEEIDMKYTIFLKDGSYATIDREQGNFEIYLRDLKFSPTKFKNEKSMLTTLEEYITNHKYNRYR